MQTQTLKNIYSPEEYLALEEKAEYKSEYRDGEIVPMTGVTTNHNKFFYYRSIPEFKEYILVDQTTSHVMQHNKTPEGKWLLTEYESVDAFLQLQSVNFQINLNELSEGVNFGETEEE